MSKKSYRHRDTQRQIHSMELWKLMLHVHKLLVKGYTLKASCGQIKTYLTKYRHINNFNTHRNILDEMINKVRKGDNRPEVLDHFKSSILKRNHHWTNRPLYL